MKKAWIQIRIHIDFKGWIPVLINIKSPIRIRIYTITDHKPWKAMFRIRIRPDPKLFGLKDPDPKLFGLKDPDPDPDPKLLISDPAPDPPLFHTKL